MGLAAELALFRQPKVIMAALAIIFVPSLYVLIYVSSVWAPYDNLWQLRAALVNEDVPVQHAGREVNLGAEVAATLEKQQPFGFVRYATPEAARQAVRDGEAFFALTIPADFSRTALGGMQPAPLTMVLSEGGNYTASIFSRRFGLELAHTVNEKIARERWAMVVGGEASPPDAVTLRSGLHLLQAGGKRVAEGAARVNEGSVRLRDGLARAQAGGREIAQGAAPLSDGATRLTAGMKQVEAAVASIRSSLPDDAKLAELADGSRDLAHGTAQLKDGLGRLEAGVPRLESGAIELQAGAAKVPLFGGKLAAGTGRLRDGIGVFSDGISRAAKGSTELNDGMIRLDSAIQPLSAGLVRLNAGLVTLSEKLPPTDQLDLFDHSMTQLRDGSVSLSSGLDQLAGGATQLETGSRELTGGADRLAAGLDEAATRFDAGFGHATAALLAAPVEVKVDASIAPVANNGQAFAPYFSALSIWIGAVMMSFVFYLRRLPESQRSAPAPVRWFAKATPLFVLGVLQAGVVVGVLKLLLAFNFSHPWSVLLAAVLGSVCFVSILLCLMSLLGDAGRLLAVILLILQLAASGGIYPIELSPEFYQRVSDYLPFTHLVHLFRATMFDAFNGRWGHASAALGAFAVTAMIVSMLLARWKYVPNETYGPAVEF
ncbi:MAG: YhgE/Pip domain-containing protein [Lacunisphaera sp.]